MTCETFQDLIFLDVAGALEPDERDALHAHLAAGCAGCLEALHEARALAARADAAVPAIAAPPAAALARLMDRIGEAPATPAGRPSRPRQGRVPQQWLRRLTVPVAAGLAAAAAIALAINNAWAVYRDIYPPSADQLAAGLPPISYRPQLCGASWNRNLGIVSVDVSHLPPPSPGREYELWLGPPDGEGHPVRARSFGPDAFGSARLSVPVPAELTQPLSILVTEESVGAPRDQPTGATVVAGTLP